MCGFIAQLVEHPTGIAEVMGSNPVEALIFFRLLSNCLKTQYCPLTIAHCDVLVAIFVMLKILRLLFVAIIELVYNNGPTNRGTQSIIANTGPLNWKIYCDDHTSLSK